MKHGYEKFFENARKASAGGEPPVRKAVEKLRQRQLERRAKRRRPKFPLYPILSSAAIAGLAALGYSQADRVDEWLARVEVGVFGHASAAEQEKPAKSEKPAAGPAEKPEKAAEAKVVEKKAEAPNVKQWTPEELSFFSKLSERKKELDLREAELAKLEEELQRRKAELDEKLKALEEMRSEISKALKTRVATDQGKVDKLVQVYSSMKAAQAAKVIETLNEDLAVEILDKMKKKSAAEILDMMNAKKARRLSELLTGYERSPAAEDDEPAVDAASAKTEPAATVKK